MNFLMSATGASISMICGCVIIDGPMDDSRSQRIKAFEANCRSMAAQVGPPFSSLSKDQLRERKKVANACARYFSDGTVPDDV